VLGAAAFDVIDTDERLAKLVGTLLHTAGRTSDAMADVHVVAVCASADVAIVITSDPDSIAPLAAAIPGPQVMPHYPQSIAENPSLRTALHWLKTAGVRYPVVVMATRWCAWLPGGGRGYPVVVMATTGFARATPPIEPSNGASPKAKTPPSEATSQ